MPTHSLYSNLLWWVKRQVTPWFKSISLSFSSPFDVIEHFLPLFLSVFWMFQKFSQELTSMFFNSLQVKKNDQLTYWLFRELSFSTTLNIFHFISFTIFDGYDFYVIEDDYFKFSQEFFERKKYSLVKRVEIANDESYWVQHLLLFCCKTWNFFHEISREKSVKKMKEWETWIFVREILLFNEV